MMDGKAASEPPVFTGEWWNRPAGPHGAWREPLPAAGALRVAMRITLRHNRLDNFWFTLFHELAHVSLHFESEDVDAFYDDITKASKDHREKEADEFASEALIPKDAWKKAKLRRNTPPANVVEFAEKLRISPSIPAGRIRFESNDCKVMRSLIGNGKVRPMFGLSA